MKAKRFLKKPVLTLPRIPSRLEAEFLSAWSIYRARQPLALRMKLFDPICQYQFVTVRQWKFDFAWPHVHLAVECDGGQWRKGGKSAHSGGTALQRNNEKQNAAMLAGWCILRYTTSDMEKRPMQCVEEVAGELLRRLGDAK